MQFDPAQHSVRDGYKLVSNLVLPRPIAWVSTLGDAGVVNLAPFSFFNLVGNDPLYVMVSISTDEQNQEKHTAINITRQREFVVNLVTEALMPQMNVSAANFPAEVSEVTATGLTTAPALKIRTPRIVESPVNFECTLHQTVPLGPYTMFIGKIVMVHADDALVDSRFHVHHFFPLGRMGAPASYCRTGDTMDLPRISYQQWLDTRPG